MAWSRLTGTMNAGGYNIDVPLTLVNLGPGKLSIQATQTHGLGLIVEGNVRHYDFVNAEVPAHQESRDGSTFYINGNRADILLSKLSNPTNEPDLVRRLLESKCTFQYGFINRYGGFRSECFDGAPEWGIAGFKVLQEGPDTLLYLCQSDISDLHTEIKEALVRLPAEDRNAFACKVESSLSQANGLIGAG